MKTAQTCIDNAEQIIAEFADKLTDEGRADLAAVVAMAKWVEAYNQSRRPWATDEQMERWFTEEREAFRKYKAALAAAGVEVKREG